MTDKQIKGIMSKKSNHWATPLQLKNRINFDLDPCPLYNDIEKWDGLKSNWYGNVFVNPPYSDINNWVDKCLSEIKNDDVTSIKVLIPARTDTKYFHKLMKSNHVSRIIFFKGRLHFNETKGGTFPSILIYINKGRWIPSMEFLEARGSEKL